MTTTSPPRIGDPAPDFTAETTHGKLSFYDWKRDSWAVLFSHPAAFTPVCSSELTEFARRAGEFTARNAKLLALSVDSVHTHLAWIEGLRRITHVEIGYPLIADRAAEVARLYGVIHPNEASDAAVRALFLIDPKHTVRAALYYPRDVGRSVDEVLRALTALQAAQKHGVACPAGWTPGLPVVAPEPRSLADVAAARGAPGASRLDFYWIEKDLPDR